jgi:hypothetical protein
MGPARKLIHDPLIAAPGNEAMTAELVSATGRNRSALWLWAASRARDSAKFFPGEV